MPLLLGAALVSTLGCLVAAALRRWTAQRRAAGYAAFGSVAKVRSCAIQLDLFLGLELYVLHGAHGALARLDAGVRQHSI
jgi:hypothetical protein